MKLKELRSMGSLESRIYRSIFRLVMFGYPGNYNGFYYSNKGSQQELSRQIADLEISDIFDMYSEEDMMHIRGFGTKCLSRLKELV